MRKMIVLSGAGLVLAFGLAGSSARATFPGTDGRVVFSLGRALFTMNPDGRAVRRLTHPPAGLMDTDAKWSPDGSTLVFQRDTSDEKGEIYSIGADGSGLKQLTHCDVATDKECFGNGSPTWTPDGKTIVFSHCCTAVNGGDAVGLATMAPDGSAFRQLTLDPDLNWGDFGPTVSPDGRWVAFNRLIGATPGNADQSVSALFVVGIDGSGLRQVTSYDLMVDEKDWSPDGSRIVFTSHAGTNGGPARADLFSIAPDGSALTQLTHTTPGQTFACCPSWAPSGRRIMFLSSAPGGSADIYTMRPDGGDQRQVSRTAAAEGKASWGTVPLECLVPDVRRMRLAAARRAVLRADCAVGRVVRAFSNSVRKGRVISQRPPAGKLRPERGRVTLIVSSGRGHGQKGA